LRAGDPGQPLAIHDGQSHQLTARPGKPIEQGLRDVHDPGTAQVTQSERDELGREHVIALLSGLPYVVASGKLRKQSVRCAAWNPEVIRDARHRRAFRIRGQVFEDAQCSFKDAGHGGRLIVPASRRSRGLILK
jgi:hypothetical protein